jgi:hypothetical protein
VYRKFSILMTVTKLASHLQCLGVVVPYGLLQVYGWEVEMYDMQARSSKSWERPVEVCDLGKVVLTSRGVVDDEGLKTRPHKHVEEGDESILVSDSFRSGTRYCKMSDRTQAF